MTKGASGQGGFSLIELMVVVAIIGILATIASNNYQAMVDRARGANAKTELAGMITGYAALQIDTGFNNFNGVEANVDDCRMQLVCTDGTVPDWKGPYFQLDSGNYYDPWLVRKYYVDNDYTTAAGVVPVVVSFGPDKLEEYPTGASDDIYIVIPNYVP